ncbi:class I SAM-dependent methyltransferase [Candidatus Chlorohelix sp.]|uniref:class I SAM-dependent methyltransferase n=1 Tax=Candidatus Chlorohelix sp. TaxID=3139201 RepID=UPI00304F746F
MQSTEAAFQFDYENEAIIEGRGIGNSAARDLGAIRLRRFLAAFAALPSGAKVMEVGCGAGRQCRTLKKLRPELEVHGCDLSQRAIAEAKANNDGVEYRISDAAQLPYPDADFDAVMLFDVLEHVPDVGNVVSEIARALKQGGLFHAFIPIEGQPGTLFYRLRNSRLLPIARWKKERIGHIQQLTDTDLIALFAANGLTLVDKSYSFHLMGQILDIADYWQRDWQSGNRPVWQKKFAALVARGIMYPTWRLAYLEDNRRASNNRATGFHLTCRKL